MDRRAAGGQGRGGQTPPIGRLPTAGALDLAGLNLTPDQLELLLTVDPEVWSEEAALIPPVYEKFGDRLPQALWDEHEALVERLDQALLELGFADGASPLERQSA